MICRECTRRDGDVHKLDCSARRFGETTVRPGGNVFVNSMDATFIQATDYNSYDNYNFSTGGEFS